MADLKARSKGGARVSRAELQLLFQLRFEFLQAFLGEALFEGAAVEDLEGGDLGAVLLDVIAEGLDEAFGFLLRGGVEAVG